MFSDRTRTTLVLVASFGLACAGNRASEPSPCDPPDARPMTSASSVISLVGEYRLSMTATQGPRAGSTVTGRLTLIAPQMGDGASRADSVALIGWSDLDVASVGAVVAGNLVSRDVNNPGVAVLRQNSTITLRLGSEANRSGLQRFDGAFTALTVNWSSFGSFGGRWASGVQGPDVRGTYCGVRRE